VPWVSQRFGWWLQPAGRETEKRNLIGIVVVVALYGVALFAFSWVP
jgi:hypothetical protein